MSLRHAILTALIEKPSSGLALTHRFDRSIGYFWQATHDPAAPLPWQSQALRSDP